MKVRDRKIGEVVNLIFVLALFIAPLEARAAKAQTSQAAAQQPAPLIQSVEGADLYKAYCASCHGPHGKGDGPVARSLKVAPPDLTRLASKGRFPTDLVRNTILGEAVVAAHGTREMPIWGPVFHQIEADVDRGHVRTQNLLKYLESIQAVGPLQAAPAKKSTAESIPTGVQLYKRYCAACHGNDLKGNGPAPAPFKDVPPDLTTLARRHGGNFPEDYVVSVMRSGVAIPAHGPPEMPTWNADFKAGDGLNEAQVSARIANITEYLKSQQAK